MNQWACRLKPQMLLHDSRQWIQFGLRVFRWLNPLLAQLKDLQTELHTACCGVVGLHMI